MKKVYNPSPSPRPRRRIKYGRLILPVMSLVLVTLVLWLGLQWTLKTLAWHFIPVQRVDNGVLEDRLTLQVYIARKEQVIVAPVTGKLIPLVPEGERVPEGATIARLLPVAVEPYGPGPIDIKAPFSGQVSYQTDGLEKVLQPANLENISYQELKGLVKLASPVSAGGQVKSGTAIIRLVNNLEPLGIYVVMDEWPHSWQEGERVLLKVPGQDTEVQARITRMQDAGSQKVVIMEVPRWDISWLKPRQVEVNAILNYYRGVIVPVEALSTGPGGEPGVYLFDTRGIKWQPVTNLGQVGDKAAVRGLKAGSEVVTKPKLARWLADKFGK